MKPKRPGSQSGTPPCLEFAQAFHRARPKTPPLETLYAQIGVPADLRYLRDGLIQTRRGVRAYTQELDNFLRAVPGSRLDPEAMASLIDRVLEFIGEQGWEPDDLRLAEMKRPTENDPHPLEGYCLGVLHHWANLFYTLEPSAGASRLAMASGHQPYEELMDEFSSYVIAAYSHIEASSYIQYCKTWWRQGIQPETSPIPDRILRSRVGSASRAMRRITRTEYTSVFEALTGIRHEYPFHVRLSNALRRSDWTDDEEKILNDIARLVEYVKPGWSRPGVEGHEGSESGKASSIGTARRNFRDGYVRVAAEDVVAETIESEDGQIFEIVRAGSENVDEGDLPDEDESHDKDVIKPESDQQDGSEWMPAADLLGEELIESLLIDEDEQEGSFRSVAGRPIRSQWAEGHLRKAHYAHAIHKSRVSAADIRAVLKAIKNESPGNDLRVLLVLLHIMIATGRSLDEARRIVLTRSDPDVAQKPEPLLYRLDLQCWSLLALPPAWADLPVVTIERPIAEWLHLPDVTGFGQYLKRFSLDREGQLPIKVLTQFKVQNLQSWLGRVRPDANLRLSACAGFLFQRVLAVSQGDLGVARLITGKPFAHGASIAHYAHYTHARLAARYSEAMNLERKREGPLKTLEFDRFDEEKGFGARRVPELAAVRKLISTLSKSLPDETMAERHNRYTCYTLAGLVLGIGLRAITDPHILNITNDDPLVTFIDKARSDYHRRVNALPAVLMTQLDYYSDYLRALQLQHRQIEPDIGKHAFLYMDADSGRYEAFSPSRFEGITGSYFGLELYSLRRFARTDLIQNLYAKFGAKGKDVLLAEDVDVYMGHWFDRVSPHDPLSTYPMQRLRMLADGAVSAMLRKLGYTATRYA